MLNHYQRMSKKGLMVEEEHVISICQMQVVVRMNVAQMESAIHMEHQDICVRIIQNSKEMQHVLVFHF